MAGTVTVAPAGASRRRPLLTLLVGVLLIALAVFGDDLHGAVTARGKVPEVLATAGVPVHIVVELPFEPERYHLERLSELGSFAGRAGAQTRVRLIRVTPENLERISHLYWVDSIEPLRIGG
ncbi:MAG TPA: hypothetical protein VK891_04310 [Euzebyales bacterium]|nr:hypothetical protein [Euzebyales bacterium]